MTKIAAAIGAATLLVVVLTPDGAAAQCAMCRRALASPEGLQLIAALRRGIVVLLAAPFMLFGVVAFLAIRMQQRRRRGGQEPPVRGIRDAALQRGFPDLPGTRRGSFRG